MALKILANGGEVLASTFQLNLMHISLSLFIMCHLRINSQMLMPITKAKRSSVRFKAFLRHPKLRMQKAQSIEDLLGHTSFGIRCHIGKLSMKVENGCLVKHRYTQGKKEI